MYQLAHKFPNDVILQILGNEEISKLVADIAHSPVFKNLAIVEENWTQVAIKLSIKYNLSWFLKLDSTYFVKD